MSHGSFDDGVSCGSVSMLNEKSRFFVYEGLVWASCCDGWLTKRVERERTFFLSKLATILWTERTSGAESAKQRTKRSKLTLSTIQNGNMI